MPLSGTASKGSDTAPRRTHRVRRLFVGAVAGLAALALVGAAYQATATEADNGSTHRLVSWWT
jgi:hypothetical protein